MRLILKLFLLCLVVVSFSSPLGNSDKHANEKVMYKEKINSNTSTVEIVILPFSKLIEIRNQSELGTERDKLELVPELISSGNVSSTKSANETIQQLNLIDLNATQPLENSTIINAHLETPNLQSQFQNEEESMMLPEEDDSEDQKTLFHFRGPGLGRPPPPRPAQVQVPTMNEEDRKARESWGGDCLSDDWKRCSKIDGWGGNYYIKDKKNPGKFILKTDGKIPCVSAPRAKNMEKTYCLNNGFTVARCHMLCMSQCNNDYRITYDKLVRHEGQCANPLLTG